MSAATDLRKSVHRSLRTVSRVMTVPTQRFRDLPDFLIIGAQRCGTTSMYKYLQQHPAVAPAVMGKGVHFFDVNYTRGEAWYRSHFPSRAYKMLQSKRSGGVEVLTGEGSPYYLFHPAVPQRVDTILPNVRVIAMLRDPVSRAHSHYQHEVARGFEELAFEDALAIETERLAGEEERLLDPAYRSFSHQHHSYVARGRYVEQIRRWREFVPAERMLIIDSGDFFRHPEDAYQAALSFLGLPPHSLTRYPSLNARRYAPMSERASTFLNEAFEESDRALAAFLQRTFSW